MNPQAAQHYLRTRVLTATPEQLQLLLYDGAIRFGEQARVALAQKNYEQSFNLITRMQKILTEMSSSLKHELAPDLCGKLASLYSYAYRKLIDANMEQRIEALDEALDVLRYQRETWMMLLSEIGQKKAAQAANGIDLPAPSERMEATISMTG